MPRKPLRLLLIKMLIIIPRVTTKKRAERNTVKEMTNFKWNNRKYLFNTKERRKGRIFKRYKKHRKQIAKQADMNPTLPVITSSVNGLTTPLKRQRLIKWIFKNKQQNNNKKYDSTVCCLQEIHFSLKDTNRLKVKVRKTFGYTIQQDLEWLY